ncbi:MAG: glycosyltransferase family 9 protein [Chloroflexota bacterium]
MLDTQKIKRLLAVCLDDEAALPGLVPALEKLRKDLPDAALSLLTMPQYCEKARSLGFLAHLLAYPSRTIEYLDVKAVCSLIEHIRQGHFDTAIIFTRLGHSPYLPAYACYLAGVPIRAGQSLEFGGGVLSHCFTPAPADSEPQEAFLYLLHAAGL